MPDPALPTRLDGHATTLLRLAAQVDAETSAAPWRSLSATAMRDSAQRTSDDLRAAAERVGAVADTLRLARRVALARLDVLRCAVDDAAHRAAGAAVTVGAAATTTVAAARDELERQYLVGQESVRGLLG